VQDELLSKV